MEHILKITIVGLISGITGTGIGGLIAFFVDRKISNRLLSSILEFSAGLMTSVVCFELVPEAVKISGLNLTVIGIGLGILVVILLDDMVKRLDSVKNTKGNSGLLRTGILVSIGLALHNLPEGFAVGSGFEASVKLGITLTIIIVIHDVPEGIAMALPMKIGGFSAKKAFLLTVLSGVPMGLGAFVGAVLGHVSQQFIALCLGFAGGAMLYVVFGELIPESKRIYVGRMSSVGNILGIVCGIIITMLN
ncbi:ZIP family metal transporter [Ruminiclostridium cellulolyticum]|uniref:Zinc/iron permease n=1 Tax=Ruminiclostridium cellulolyticum (strain ATCC 35319 / DSM 5812 / JCM 6584 / H10) TaxID=394503 RepID=B8I563_RUMCH|nr:ZIP family metal transporter [Ruminiclostridium cellulolyticum]ACL74643.1 zinc/iron permease [Ruminiclostridium cellulolyticum H10]